jgi:hypothetical protein
MLLPDHPFGTVGAAPEDRGGRREAHNLPPHWDIAYGAYRFRVRPMNCSIF